jgi:hypothetical protein
LRAEAEDGVLVGAIRAADVEALEDPRFGRQPIHRTGDPFFTSLGFGGEEWLHELAGSWQVMVIVLPDTVMLSSEKLTPAPESFEYVQVIIGVTPSVVDGTSHIGLEYHHGGLQYHGNVTI